MTTITDPHVATRVDDVPDTEPTTTGPTRQVETDQDLPPWRRQVLGAILAVAAGLYTWALSATGAVNQYYAAAAMSGSVDLKAWFFGSLDSGNFITVDKAPFALWIQVASVRLFGYSDWSLILPQAAAGVATVALVYAAVTRLAGARAGLIAAATLTLTPVTVTLTRSNLPDGFLVLSLVAAAWALTRAIQDGQTRWLMASMAFVGLGFNAKMLQAWVVLPALGLTWLVFAPHPLVRRVRSAVIGGVVALAVSFSWLTVVDLWPASSRPYVGGSDNNTVLDLVLGYNGLGRIFGQNGGVGSSFNPFDSGVSWLRMFNPENGDQISWLLPTALIGLVATAVLAWRSRDRAVGAGLLLWGGWLVVTAAVFSRAAGIYHPYYTTALAPGIAAVVGITAVTCWRHRTERWVVATMAGALVVTGWWAQHLIGRVGSWNPWLGPTALALSVIAAAALLASVAWPANIDGRRGTTAIAGLALAALLLAPGIYSTASLFNNSPGQSPEAGPAVASSGPGAPAGNAGTPGSNSLGNGAGPTAGPTTGSTTGPTARPTPPGDAGSGGVDQALVDYLLEQHDSERWIVAVNGSQVAAPIIIDTGGEPVLSFGGFNGTDATPTADELAALVDSGELRYVLVSSGGAGAGQGQALPAGPGPGGQGSPGAGGQGGPGAGGQGGPGSGGQGGPGSGGPGGDSATSTERTAWVEDNCTAVTSITTNTGVLWDCAP